MNRDDFDEHLRQVHDAVDSLFDGLDKFVGDVQQAWPNETARIDRLEKKVAEQAGRSMTAHSTIRYLDKRIAVLEAKLEKHRHPFSYFDGVRGLTIHSKTVKPIFDTPAEKAEAEPGGG